MVPAFVVSPLNGEFDERSLIPYIVELIIIRPGRGRGVLRRRGASRNVNPLEDGQGRARFLPFTLIESTSEVVRDESFVTAEHILMLRNGGL